MWCAKPDHPEAVALCELMNIKATVDGKYNYTTFKVENELAAYRKVIDDYENGRWDKKSGKI